MPETDEQLFKIFNMIKFLMGPPEFESGSPAPQAGRMDQATPRSHSVKSNYIVDQINV